MQKQVCPTIFLENIVLPRKNPHRRTKSRMSTVLRHIICQRWNINWGLSVIYWIIFHLFSPFTKLLRTLLVLINKNTNLIFSSKIIVPSQMTWHIEQTSALRHFGCNTYFMRVMVLFMFIISRNLHGCCKKSRKPWSARKSFRRCVC